MSSSSGARSGASWGLALSSRLRLCRGMCLVFSVVVAVVLAVGIGVSVAVYEHVSWGELWGWRGHAGSSRTNSTSCVLSPQAHPPPSSSRLLAHAHRDNSINLLVRCHRSTCRAGWECCVGCFRSQEPKKARRPTPVFSSSWFCFSAVRHVHLRLPQRARGGHWCPTRVHHTVSKRLCMRGVGGGC